MGVGTAKHFHKKDSRMLNGLRARGNSYFLTNISRSTLVVIKYVWLKTWINPFTIKQSMLEGQVAE